LYILDLGPCFRGYYADNCRTIAVGHSTEEQHKAWEQIVRIFTLVETTIRPGKSCREFFEEVRGLLESARPLVFDHHLGHGIGLFPHETPHINPNWDDMFQEGDVFACEPGLYGPSLRKGIRLENNYRVTESGVELLSDFSLKL
jgi:Xaa-Pro aminopeptidase